MVQAYPCRQPGKLLDDVVFQGLYEARDFIIFYIMHLTAFPLTQLIFLYLCPSSLKSFNLENNDEL